MSFNPIAGGAYPNLVNVAKSLDPDGSIAKVAEMYAQTNPIIKDLPLVEGNLPTGHRTTLRGDIPTPGWRRFYEGVRPTVSGKVQVDDVIGMCEDRAIVDCELANLNGNSAAFRLSEDSAHIEGISKKMATAIFYGDTITTPDGFHGLAPRYNALSITATKPGAVVRSAQLPNVISLSGSANLTSMWLLLMGPNTIHGIYPKGSKAGLVQRDLGEVTMVDDEGKRFQAYETLYQWKLGLCVRDWRCAVRICNIDTSKIGDATVQKALYTAMIKAIHTLPAGVMGQKVFYCGAAVAAMLDLAAVEKSNAAFGATELFGEEVMTFRKIPLRQCDALIESETALT